MCHYVTAVLPESADLEALGAIAAAHGRQFRPLANPSIERRLLEGERYFLTTLGHCDCGTAFGARNAPAGRRRLDPAAETTRLRAKGWSEAKIARALSQKAGAASRAKAARAARDRSASTDWVRFVHDVLSSKATPYVGLLLHWYSGALSTRIELAGREAVPGAAVAESVLLDAKEDVLYVFRSGR